jgi:FkbM family methyltransferase
MYQQLKSVFSKLQDELSKEIFLYKLICALSKDYKTFDYVIPAGNNGLREYTQNFLKTITSLYDFSCENKPVPLFKFLLGYDGHKKTVIYGSGNTGQETYHGLKDWGINVECFCDSDKNKHGTLCCGIPVISPETLAEKYNNSIIIISVWSEKSFSVIVENLLKYGFKMMQLVSTFSISDQYFCYPFFLPTDNETYLDIGCLDGNSIADYIKFCSGRYKNIIGLEPDTLNFKTTVNMINDKKFKNVNIISKGVWSSTTELHFNNTGNGSSRIVESGDVIVPVTKIDDVLAGYEGGNMLIKMDVEGAELEVLKGAKSTLLSNKPRLAICLYHKPEDIIDIPVFLSDLVPEYRFFIRHNNLYNMTETVLFAFISGGGGGRNTSLNFLQYIIWHLEVVSFLKNYLSACVFLLKIIDCDEKSRIDCGIPLNSKYKLYLSFLTTLPQCSTKPYIQARTFPKDNKYIVKYVIINASRFNLVASICIAAYKNTIKSGGIDG